MSQASSASDIVYVMKEQICYVTKYFMSIFLARVAFIKLHVLFSDFYYLLSRKYKNYEYFSTEIKFQSRSSLLNHALCLKV
jgi:hypothetical protein